ncbi:hypothetical protein BDV11DRAFT_210111 [Aspergillus similis]
MAAVSGCELFYTVQDGDTCPSIERKYGIRAALFYSWNPSIGSTCTNMWLGYAYCVKGPASSATTSAPGPNDPAQTGIASNCNKNHSATYGITFAQLYGWIRVLARTVRLCRLVIPYNLERLMEADGFSRWGFAIYRCTYESDADWDAFMARLNGSVTKLLELGNGLDILDSYAPTVLQDPSFAGATTATLRAHFRKIWTPAAFEEENPGLSMDILPAVEAGRYRFFIMVDQEALESVLRAPGRTNRTGFVRLVNAEWEPQAESEGRSVSQHGDSDGDADEEDQLVPLEGSTAEDVGWMNVLYDQAQLTAYLDIQRDWDWEDYYERPPVVLALE